MGLRAVIIFRNGKRDGGFTADKADSTFKTLTEEGVKILKRSAKEYLRGIEIVQAVTSPFPYCIDTMNCLLDEARIAFVPAYSESKILAPDDETQMQAWFKTLDAAEKMAKEKGQENISPDLLAEANPALVLETGERIYEFMRKTALSLKNRTHALMVSHRGLIESVICFLQKKRGSQGKIVLDRLLDEGDALTFKFDGSKDDKKDWHVSFNPVLPALMPHEKQLMDALNEYGRATRQR